MKLSELSETYRDSAARLRIRIRELELLEAQLTCRDERLVLQGRIRELKPLLREMQDLAVLTARYYERGYRRNERYRL